MSIDQPPPGFQKACDDFSRKMEEHLANVKDLGAALKTSTTVLEALDQLEARRLIRQLPEIAGAN